MDREPEYRLELSPSVVDTHYAPNGSVAAALIWIELVVSGETAGTDHHAPPLTLLLRLSLAGWLVAGHGRTPVQAGWPPCRR